MTKGEAITARIAIESLRPNEAQQRHPRFPRQLDGETRWRADCRDDGNPSHQRLLNQLEAHPATDDEYSLMSGQDAGDELGADHFVERIVTPDVLAQHKQSCVEVVQRRRV